VAFPSTDSRIAAKERPALVLHKNGNQDLLLCMMTTISRNEPEEVLIFAGEASLKKNTYVRTHKIMTVHESFISRKTGGVSDSTWQNIIRTIKSWLQ
jgi:mRNA-degrading endonuclease toxin of MazEF toxin-antitoxin module